MASASSDQKGFDATVSEATPLLAASEAGPVLQSNEETIFQQGKSSNGSIKVDDEKQLPRTQIFLLCLARMIEGLAFFGIFPFINKMIKETGDLDEADVGFYSGLIESMFSFTQMLLMIPWGRASDRIGRKPVLVLSLCGVAIATAIFGLSKTIWQMVLFRCCAGVFAGTVVTIRSMISEHSTPKTQARAFSFFAFSGNLGIFAGPVIGGFLSNPAEQYPKVFGQFKFLRDYPYALPTIVIGSIGGIAALVCGLFVKETLKRKAKGDETSSEPLMTTWEVLKAPGVGVVLYLYAHVMLLGLAYTAVSPVFWFTSVELGGYGFSPMQISMFIASIGVSQAAWLLFVFPPLQHRIGTGGVLRLCLIAWPIFFVSAPLCNVFLRHNWTVAFWIVAPVCQIAGSGVAMAFTGVQLALNDISPSPATLGTLNGLALTLTSGIRSVGPAIFTSIFAAGAKSQLMDGHFVWAVMVVIALVGAYTVRWLPEKAEGKLKYTDGE